MHACAHSSGCRARKCRRFTRAVRLVRQDVMLIQWVQGVHANEAWLLIQERVGRCNGKCMDGVGGLVCGHSLGHSRAKESEGRSVNELFRARGAVPIVIPLHVPEPQRVSTHAIWCQPQPCHVHYSSSVPPTLFMHSHLLVLCATKLLPERASFVCSRASQLPAPSATWVESLPSQLNLPTHLPLSRRSHTFTPLVPPCCSCALRRPCPIYSILYYSPSAIAHRTP